MVNWGFPTTTPWGRADDVITLDGVYPIGGSVRVVFTPRTGYSGYYKIYMDGVAGPVTYATAGTETEVIAAFADPDFAPTNHIISICPQGTWPNDLFDLSSQSFGFMSGRTDRIWARITTAKEYFVYSTSGIDTQLSAWALTGVERFRNCMPVSNRPTWAALSLTIGDTAGTRTVTLSIGTVTVATGSRSGDGSITLAEANGSGISGTVTIAYTGDLSGTLIIRYPNQLKIHYKTSAFSAPDFPRTAEGTINDDGVSSNFFFRSARIAAGTYYVVPHQVNENGVESSGIAGGGTTVTVHAPPEPAGVPVYTSGNYSNTLISFAASSTTGATYNIYDSGDTGILDINTAAATHIAGTGTLTQTLAAISGTFTGIRYVVIRAVYGGVEEGSYRILEIEYASGTVVLPRPNTPMFNERCTVSGRTITVPVALDTVNAKATAATFKLFLVASGGSFNYASPDGSAAVSTAKAGSVHSSVSATVLADGYYDYMVRTQTAGGVQDDNTQRYGPVYLAAAAPLDPASFEVKEGM